MKVKRATKISVLAIAVVAMFGIATVSFAAWQDGNGTVTANAATPTIDMNGFLGELVIDDLAIEGSTAKKGIVPFDQETGFDASQHAKIVSFQLPDYEVTYNYTITVKQDGTLPFRVLIGDAKVTSVSDISAWGELTTEATTVITENVTSPKTVTAGKWITIVLDSSDVNDMNQSVTFTVELTQAERP